MATWEEMATAGAAATDANLLVIDATAAGAALAGVSDIVEQVPALVLGVAEEQQREDAGRQVDFSEQQSSPSEEPPLAAGAWSLSAQRLASKAAKRRRVKTGKKTRNSITITKFDQPAPPLDTSMVSRTGTGFSGAMSGSTVR